MLFILESLGTQELILIGLVALIFLGPRKLPELARKFGKIMADLKRTSGEFRETWEREVDFEEEKKAFSGDSLSIDKIDAEIAEERSIARTSSAESETAMIETPTVKEIDPSSLEISSMKPAEGSLVAESNGSDTIDETVHMAEQDPSDKRTWL